MRQLPMKKGEEMKKKYTCFSHGIENNGGTFTIARFRLRFAVLEWIAEDPAHRSRLLRSEQGDDLLIGDREGEAD